MVGIGLNDIGDLVLIKIFFLTFAQEKRDLGSALWRVIGFPDSIFTLSFSFPDMTLRIACFTRFDHNAPGHHERGIEADTELADQVHPVGGAGLA